MPCDYCGSWQHPVTRCPWKRQGERVETALSLGDRLTYCRAMKGLQRLQRDPMRTAQQRSVLVDRIDFYCRQLRPYAPEFLREFWRP